MEWMWTGGGVEVWRSGCSSSAGGHGRGVPVGFIEWSRREVQCSDRSRRMIERCLRRSVWDSMLELQ